MKKFVCYYREEHCGVQHMLYSNSRLELIDFAIDQLKELDCGGCCAPSVKEVNSGRTVAVYNPEEEEWDLFPPSE